MKRILLILLAVLLLAGCGRKKQSETTQTDQPSQTMETVSCYIPESSVEKQTAGAVRVYELEDDSYFGLSAMGGHLLLMGQKGLTVLVGEQGQVSATLATEAIRPTSAMDFAATGMAYYSPNSRQVTVLNPQLQQVVQMELPKEITGDPCISIAKNEVYYSTGSEIRALNMTTGISRLVRQQSTSTQLLLGAYFDGTVLLCQMTDASGVQSVEYISGETGQTISQSQETAVLQTYGNQYFAFWQDGIVEQSAFGTRGDTAQCLLIQKPDGQGGRAAIPEMNGMVDHTMTDSGLELTYYDLNVGKRTARTVFSGVQSPIAFCSDGKYIWLLATDTEKTCHALYRWDVTLSGQEDGEICTGPLYTAENPDTEGLAQCQVLANSYQTQYGIKLLFWQDAVKNTGGYTVTAEHNPQVITAMMEKLQPLLAQFPANFLLKTVEAGWIKLALVRDIQGEADWVQFWEEGDCWVLLSADGDVVSGAIQGIAYGIDSHVLGNSRELDTWNELNPTGFSYSYSAEGTGSTQYLTGEKRAFADSQAMTYPREDRCRVFYNAMLSDNAEMFQSSAMQAKLLRLCAGIREAYNLEKKTDTYIWEQYLQTSLAYVPAK